MPPPDRPLAMSNEPRPGSATARAVVWAFLATAAGRVISLAGMAVLARLVAPREFGLMGFALVFLTYAETVGDLGIGTALVYWPDRRRDAAQVTFLLNLAMGWVWFGLFVPSASVSCPRCRPGSGAHRWRWSALPCRCWLLRLSLHLSGPAERSSGRYCLTRRRCSC